jgi:hypothetical protein
MLIKLSMTDEMFFEVQTGSDVANIWKQPKDLHETSITTIKYINKHYIIISIMIIMTIIIIII